MVRSSTGHTCLPLLLLSLILFPFSWPYILFYLGNVQMGRKDWEEDTLWLLQKALRPSCINLPSRNHSTDLHTGQSGGSISHLGFPLSTWLYLVSSWHKSSLQCPRSSNERLRGTSEHQFSSHSSSWHNEISCHQAFPLPHDWLQPLKPWRCFIRQLVTEREKQYIICNNF